jgi:pyrimidine deaminase RibD-like protein
MNMEFSDEYFMKKALLEAEQAFEKGEVPVGAVIVVDNKIIARAHNLTELLNDVTAHAEMQAIIFLVENTYIIAPYMLHSNRVKCVEELCFGVKFRMLFMALPIQSVDA